MPIIQKILVANRGEIALRVMRTARAMGKQTVAVYSEADADAPHVRFADQAFCLGPGPSRESYLLADKVLEVARRSGANAIHPGYGFLSENADFARAVRDAGLIFIGPSPEAMELMGSKLAAKQAVKQYGVPLVPGLDEPITDLAAARQVAREIGFPILIKASAGGGGKGMRIVEAEAEFDQQLERAASEALNAFGDGSVFLERYVQGPRHIEIQVLADQHGHAVYLFERECSVQRRHQKVVEEAPSVILTPELRAQMGEAALAVVRACGYTNAGTVEFLVDAQRNFYFLEMNTRLQVEHPVTECITGLDLVAQQILVAEGHPLAFAQEDLQINGHAIEVRVYAEDPLQNFLPSTGRLEVYRPPTGPGIRVDDGFREGMDVPIFYDPMLAKLIVHAPTRAEAIARLTQAIDDYAVVGVETTLDFCRFVLQHPAFQSGKFDTHFVQQHFTPDALQRQLGTDEMEVAALIAGLVHHREQHAAAHSLPARIAAAADTNPWHQRRM